MSRINNSPNVRPCRDGNFTFCRGVNPLRDNQAGLARSVHQRIKKRARDPEVFRPLFHGAVWLRLDVCGEVAHG